jgi:hypothetical protein
MIDLPSNRPRPCETWQHTKTGGCYVVLRLVFNAITDQVDVLYAASRDSKSEFEWFTRQLTDHPKAFLSANDDGSPRFMLVKDAWGRTP